MHKSYQTNGVCARQIDFDYEDGKLYNLKFTGGCPGNLLALSKILDGMELTYIVEKLEGNKCGARNTSCTDQLTKAIKEVL